MKITLDSSIIVEIDRKNKKVIELMKKIIEKNHEITISTVTLSEILVGPHLRKDFKKSLLEAKKILSQFLWIDVDAKIAEKTAQLLAYTIISGKLVEYPDVVISATAIQTNSDYVLTLNKQHFDVFAELKGKIFSTDEFAKVLR